MISKIVPKTELGKVFSLLSSLESAVPLIISPIIVNIYKATIDHFAGSIFLIFSGISALVFIVLFIIYLILKNSTDVAYDRLGDENEDAAGLNNGENRSNVGPNADVNI
jgi:uncharacterized membrane protein